jgi:hypothetical protein
MPIELFDLGRLILCVTAFIIPGYLWSFLFVKKLYRLERIVFGFILTISMFILAFFVLEIILGVAITYLKTLVIFVVYCSVIVFLYVLSIKRNGISDQTKEFISTAKSLFKNPVQTIQEHPSIQLLLLLVGVLVFAAYMGFLPHLKESYYLPFHVDEWIHWTYTKSFMENGFTTFINPYLGRGIVHNLEPGFSYLVASLHWISTANFNTIFVFMPTIITMFTSLAAFNLGNRHKRPFGLEAALFVAVIPTTCRMMGASFFVPVALGLLFLTFLLWFLQLKKQLSHTLIVAIGLWVIFLIHPPTALAAMIITFIYALVILFDKQFKQSLLYIMYCFIPVGGGFALSARYGSSLQNVIDAFFGGKYFLDYNLPQIWVSFEHMGLVVWVLAIIGVYFAFSKGKAGIATISLSALSFITIIGLYDRFNYGMPIMYERSFMFLFLMIGLLAGWGLAEIRRSSIELSLDYLPLKNGKVKVNAAIKKISILIPFIVVFLLLVTTVPAHREIPYYKLINETDYDAFIWINENIDEYRTSEYLYDRAAVDPFKASAFSAITRLYIVSSILHPIPGYRHRREVYSFLSGCCEDDKFLEKFDVSVVYTTRCCTNENLTMIYPNVYILQK